MGKKVVEVDNYSPIYEWIFLEQGEHYQGRYDSCCFWYGKKSWYHASLNSVMLLKLQIVKVFKIHTQRLNSNWLLQVMWHKNDCNTDLSRVFPLAESRWNASMALTQELTKCVLNNWSSPSELDIGSWCVTHPTPARTLPSWIIKAISLLITVVD